MANSVLALGVLDGLKQRRIRVGRDIGLITFDDAPWCALLEPAISVGDQQPMQDEIVRTETLIGARAHPARLFRPWDTAGELDGRCLSLAAPDHLQRHGYSCVLWDSVPHDWDDPEG